MAKIIFTKTLFWILLHMFMVQSLFKYLHCISIMSIHKGCVLWQATAHCCVNESLTNIIIISVANKRFYASLLCVSKRFSYRHESCSPTLETCYSILCSHFTASQIRWLTPHWVVMAVVNMHRLSNIYVYTAFPVSKCTAQQSNHQRKHI